MAEVLLEDVSRVHGDGTVAVSRLSLHVRDGELLAIVGPSGSGKSTTLRLIAGVEPLSTGTILIGGRIVNDLQPHERDVAMVFEGESLYPHLTAGGNMRFGLELGKVPEREIEQRVQAESRVLGVRRVLGRLPRVLSAGQRQRVAVGRATVRVPSVFLLDEPLTNLDAAERTRLRTELSQLQRGLGVTTIYVTHDQAQAMAVGDRIAIMRRGRIEQLDTPRELYRRPANAFVASFLGTPGMALVEGQLAHEGGRPWIVLGGQRLPFPGTPSGPLRGYIGRRVTVGLRPEHLDDATPAGGAGALGGEAEAGAAPAGAAAGVTAGAEAAAAAGGALAGVPGSAGADRPRLRCAVVRVDRLGPELLAACTLDAPAVTVPDAEPAEELSGDGPTSGDRAILPARLHRHARVRPGDQIDLAVDVGQLSFFDPTTGAALWNPP